MIIFCFHSIIQEISLVKLAYIIKYQMSIFQTYALKLQIWLLKNQFPNLKSINNKTLSLQRDNLKLKNSYQNVNSFQKNQPFQTQKTYQKIDRQYLKKYHLTIKSCFIQTLITKSINPSTQTIKNTNLNQNQQKQNNQFIKHNFS
ncbi:hypothetical protein ABPG74_000112 [Tetrahymena malaccensis]